MGLGIRECKLDCGRVPVIGTDAAVVGFVFCDLSSLEELVDNNNRKKCVGREGRV